MIKPPEHISSIKPYVPGKPLEELERELGISGSIKLASNENPVGPSPLALRAVQKGIQDLNRYPDGSCFYLGNALSRKLNVDADSLLFGNGSNELIELAVRTYLDPGDEAIMAHPSFVVYSMIVQAAGKSAEQGLLNLLHFVAYISVALGLFNLFPIPILDGGHLLFFALEGLRGRPVSIKVREVCQQVGLILLLGLMVYATKNDILRILGW